MSNRLELIFYWNRWKKSSLHPSTSSSIVVSVYFLASPFEMLFSILICNLINCQHLSNQQLEDRKWCQIDGIGSERVEELDRTRGNDWDDNLEDCLRWNVSLSGHVIWPKVKIVFTLWKLVWSKPKAHVFHNHPVLKVLITATFKSLHFLHHSNNQVAF